MNIHETNCICLSNLSEEESKKYFDLMGDAYWNDVENIACIPLKEELRDDLLTGLKELAKADLSKADYLIIEF